MVDWHHGSNPAKAASLPRLSSPWNSTGPGIIFLGRLAQENEETMFDKSKAKFEEKIIDPLRNTIRLAVSALIVAVLALLVAVSR